MDRELFPPSRELPSTAPPPALASAPPDAPDAQQSASVFDSNESSPLSAVEKVALLALWCLSGIGVATLRAMKRAFGCFEAAVRAPRKELVQCAKGEAGRASLLGTVDLFALGEQALASVHRLGGQVIFPNDESWPNGLKGSETYPLLFALGNLPNRATKTLAVVGARDVDLYGQQLTAFWAGELAKRGVAIVSGGALGVDAEAHWAAIKSSGTTIAVSGTGLDHVYPPENRELFSKIPESGGAIITPFPLGVTPLPQNFILRNRLIAALSDATLVTRATPTSGAISTAQAAHALHRPVFAIPGDLTHPLSLGTQRLVESNLARPIFSLKPVADALGVPGALPSFGEQFAGISVEPPPPSRAKRSKVASSHADSSGKKAKSAHPSNAMASAQAQNAPPNASPKPAVDPATLPDDQRAVFQCLGSVPISFDELVSECRLDVPALADALLRLELSGLGEELPGRLYRRRT